MQLKIYNIYASCNGVLPGRSQEFAMGAEEGALGVAEVTSGVQGKSPSGDLGTKFPEAGDKC